MAEEVLVKESISREMISAGERLARYLVNSDIPIDALLWLYLPESNAWRFLVASPEVKTNGPKSVYQKIRSRLEQRPPSDEEGVAWDDIVVVDSNDPLIKLLRQAITTGQAISGIRFSRNVVNGVLIEDAYIYKLV
jgi:hypothetical protein